MVRVLLVALMLLWPATSTGGVVNIEFNFTPFTGDPKNETVETVAGQAAVYLNGIFLASQDVEQKEVPVLFSERQISAPIWLPMQSYGSLLRKGKNSIRIEFKPADAKKSYNAQLRWSSVMDEATETQEDGKITSTNQSGAGTDDRKAKGPITIEREFEADFAADKPWHHYPPVTALTDDDKKSLMTVAVGRLDAFKPDFSGVYALLKGQDNIDLDAVKKSGCLGRAYQAGIRLATPAADKIQFVTTGQAAVVIQSAEGQLYLPADPSLLEKITDEDDQMCIMMTLGMAYPPRLIVVRNPKGVWEVVD